jgi:hypothetical protein
MDMSDEQHFINLGRPIEGAFRAMLADVFSNGTLTRDERQLLRRVFFAGARAAAFSPGNREETTKRHVTISVELRSFGRHHVIDFPSKDHG